MSATTLSTLAGDVGGRLHGVDRLFTCVSTDTRSLPAGAVYFALRGPHFDGHGFLNDAREGGAAGAVVEVPGSSEFPQIEVEDTRRALAHHARAWRSRFRLPLIAVTGSNGKTTVKEMIAAILARRGPVLATEKNFNNEIGVPLTLLGLSRVHRHAVVELGTSRPGEIALLAGLAAPTVALVTNAAAAHLEGLGDVASVAREKGAIFASLPVDGTAIINVDDPHAPLWRELAGERRVSGFGRSAGAEFAVEEARQTYAGDTPQVDVRLSTPAGPLAVTLALAGTHNALNAAAAAAASFAAGVSLEDIGAGLGAVRGIAGRLQLLRLRTGARLLDDSYNANPASVAAALDALTALPGRHWLVFGDMGELGPTARSAHREVGRQSRERGIERLYAIGTASAEAVAAFGEGANAYAELDRLLADLSGELAPDVNVLVKGSRSARLERVVTALSARAAPGE